jgi:hypothetical protein
MEHEFVRKPHFSRAAAAALGFVFMMVPASSLLPAQAAPTPQEAPAASKPVVEEVTLPEGTRISIRITETLDTKTAQTNDAFHGVTAGDIESQGIIVIPRGSPVIGRIAEAKEAAHFKGAAMLSIELTGVTVDGTTVPVVTDNYTRDAAARGKSTATRVGGGAALGSIIGAVAGGGKGALLGGLAGGAAGTAVNGITRGQQAVIESEAVIDFSLQSPVTLSVAASPTGRRKESTESTDPQLQPR